MKHGILVQHQITTANTVELAYEFNSATAYQISFGNHQSGTATFSVALVPAGETLQNKHYLIINKTVVSSLTEAIKRLANVEDKLYVQSNLTGHISLEGIEQ